MTSTYGVKLNKKEYDVYMILYKLASASHIEEKSFHINVLSATFSFRYSHHYVINSDFTECILYAGNCLADLTL